MPELRRDPATGRWVIIATERAKRPVDFTAQPLPPTRSTICPLCEGNEHLTPKEIVALRNEGEPNSRGWRVRVVPNKFPALMVEGDLGKRGDGMYDTMSGVGAHELIIESPRHVLSLTDLSTEEIREVLWICKERLLDLRNDPRLVYGLIFKNVGARAGASLEHTHSQLIVTPIIPRRVETEIERCADYMSYRGRCLMCDMVVQELSVGERVVKETSSFIALEPYAARFPFETHIMPKRHVSHFEMTEDGLLGELAGCLRDTLLRIERAVGGCPYNYLVHTSPLSMRPLDHYHWHFEIIPRITQVAGFEWGTGFYINPMPPESAAKYLRETEVS